METDEGSVSAEQYYRSRRSDSKGLGMGLFITAEAMVFFGLIGSYLILKAIHTAPSQEALQQNTLLWLCGTVGRTPPDQNFWLPEGLKLPITVTFMNSVLLVVSSYFIYRAVQLAKETSWKKAGFWMVGTAGCGTIFLLIQGYEWGRMLEHGLSIQYEKGQIFAGLFYTIIGAHGLHVLGGLIYLLSCTKRLLTGVYETYETEESVAQLAICRNYWFFVCFLWPVLFGLLYFE